MTLEFLLDRLQNEVIVPVSMAPLQREVYRSILSMSALTS